MCVSRRLTSALSVSSLPKHVANQFREQHEKETKNKWGQKGVAGGEGLSGDAHISQGFSSC